MHSPFEMKTSESQMDKVMKKMEMMHATLNDISKQVSILKDFRNATLTSLHILRKTVKCKLPLLR